jgi:acetyl coenzyme A synthetase (ADP forming)-like protein
MAKYPSDWEFDVVLKDGAVARIRPIRTDDREALLGLFNAASPASIYHRFLRVKEELTAEELEYFTVVDYTDRMAFVAVHEDEIIAVGRYDRLPEDPEFAEVAFLVADEHQGRGIATQLLQYLTAYARAHRVTGFRAYVLADNHAMLRVFRNTGFSMRREVSEGLYTVDFPTEESPATLAAEWEHEKRAVAASIMPIFYPHSVAVIGASRNSESIGGRLFHNLLARGFTGPVYPVNPTADVVNSVRAYPSILDVPDPVDLAFIVVPEPFVRQVVEECAEKEVRGVVVISAGFSEVGDDGEKAERELLEAVRDAGMRMVGPNCMGVLNTDPAVHLDGQFGPRFPPRGNVAMSSQSGALGIAILDYASQLNIGISTFVSVGNKADVSGNDLLLYWEDDPSTDVILLYLESFGNPRRFSRIARRIGKSKPIVAVKSGRTSAGARAASSHTGSLASLDVAVDALFRQAGVVRTDTLEELFDVTALLANQPVPQGRRVAVLTNAGGPGILAADALEAQGLEVVEFSSELEATLKQHLSPEASVRNPVDMIASAGPDEYQACLDALMEADEIDAVIVIYIPAAPSGSEVVAATIRDTAIRHRDRKTMLAVFMSARGVPDQLSGDEARVPTYLFPEPAAKALARAVGYGEWRARPEGDVVKFADVAAADAKVVITEALDRVGPEGGWLEPSEVEAVLGSFGIPLAGSGVASSAQGATDVAASIGGPVVLKVVSPTAIHKSDIGGVILDVEGSEAVSRAYEEVTSVVDDAEGVLVQEFVPGGHEVIVGMTEDPLFGPLLLFGLGGVYVELLADVAFRIHPLTDLDVAEMIRDVKSARLLEGYRGGEPGDIEALSEAMLRVSAMVDELPEIVEMDLNPVKVLAPGSGIRVVDARIRVHPVVGSFMPSRKDVPAAVRPR